MPATIIIVPRDIVSKRKHSIVVALKNDKIHVNVYVYKVCGTCLNAPRFRDVREIAKIVFVRGLFSIVSLHAYPRRQ